MRRSSFQGLAAVILLAALVFPGGCAQSKPTRFYVLHSMLDARTQAQHEGQDFLIGVGPVKIPDYLDRPQMITRKGQSNLELAEFDKWAEPLDRNLARSISGNLSVLLDTESIISFPWPKAAKPKYQVSVEIIRMDGVLGGKVVLDTRWMILSVDEEKALLTKRSFIETPTPTADYDGFALAMSTAVESLSREIASAIGMIRATAPGV
jgi:uncharacterized protein